MKSLIRAFHKGKVSAIFSGGSEIWRGGVRPFPFSPLLCPPLPSPPVSFSSLPSHSPLLPLPSPSPSYPFPVPTLSLPPLPLEVGPLVCG